MGHSEEMSDNVYQNPPVYLELARITPILCAVEKGLVNDTMTISEISSKLQGNTSYVCSTNFVNYQKRKYDLSRIPSASNVVV